MKRTDVQFITRVQKQLREDILMQMGTTDEVLDAWDQGTYPADANVVADFWGHIKKAPEVVIVGDYDFDGISASHIMRTAIESTHPTKKVRVRTPHRFSEGYGISETIAREIIQTAQPGALIVTVDNGIAAAPALESLRDAGFTVICTDHHELRKGCKLPRVDMLIDPTVTEIHNPLTGRGWCGAAVSYKLCEPMVNEKLRAELETYAGIATIADCMHLADGNWGIVRHAIRHFEMGRAPKALTMLLEKMKQDARVVDEDTFGYYLGPAFNAPGRLYDDGADQMIAYLKNPTPEAASKIVEINDDRKRIRDDEVEQVEQYIKAHHLENDCPIWVALGGLHEGIVGIIAGKIAEKYKRPAIVLTDIESRPGMFKGSARSYGGFNIFAHLSSLPGDVFERMGGHAGAAGLTMSAEGFERARAVQIPPKDLLAGTSDEHILLPIQKYDIPDACQVLSAYRPFGEGNPVPEFQIEVDMDSDPARMVGSEKNHLFIEPESKAWKVTHFLHLPNDLSDQKHFRLVGTISESAFRGKRTPTMNAEELLDYTEEKERGR